LLIERFAPHASRRFGDVLVDHARRLTLLVAELALGGQIALWRPGPCDAGHRRTGPRRPFCGADRV
jgi:hypothetical protein